MPIDVLLPQWGMGMQEGTVIAWLKNEGDIVREGDLLVEVEAEKATDTIEAPASGVLGPIRVRVGETAEVYSVLAVVYLQGEEPYQANHVNAVPPGEVGPAPQFSEDPRKSEAPADKAQIEPRARRLAASLGIDLAAVRGTGPGHRISEEDVRQVAGQPTIEEMNLVHLSGTRAIIAKRMLDATQNMALLTLTAEADVTELVRHRERSGRTISYTDFVVKAAALALREHPRFNATVEPGHIRVLPQIHVGIAVSSGGDLIVPVLRDVDTKSLVDIAEESRALILRSREGGLTIDDVSSGTFTVTNLGMYGIDAFTPIVNPPQVAILGVGRIYDRPVRQGDLLAWRSAVILSLTFDHRANDGAPAAEFLNAIAQFLEQPSHLEKVE